MKKKWLAGIAVSVLVPVMAHAQPVPVTIVPSGGKPVVLTPGANGIPLTNWTTSTRPTTPVIGSSGFNTTIGAIETWNGSAWVTGTGSTASMGAW